MMTQLMADSAGACSAGKVLTSATIMAAYVNDAYKFTGASTDFLDSMVIPIPTVVITAIDQIAQVPSTNAVVAFDIEENVLAADPDGYARAIASLDWSPLVYSSASALAAITPSLRPPRLWVAQWGSTPPSLPYWAWQDANDATLDGYTVDTSVVTPALWQALDPLNQTDALARLIAFYSSSATTPSSPSPPQTPNSGGEGSTGTSTGPTSYTIAAGDNLSEIAKRFGTTTSALYAQNASVLNAAARAHGRPNSLNGWWIYPGTVIKV